MSASGRLEIGAEGSGTSSANFSVFIDDVRYVPRSVNELTLSGNPEERSISDQCGRTETISTGDKGLTLKVAGTVTETDEDGRLSKSIFIDEIMTADEIEIVCDLYAGTIRVAKPTEISQISGERNTDENGRLIFPFQMTLGEGQSDN